MANWFNEAHLHWQWLQWMREVEGEGMAPASTLPMLIDGMRKWDEAAAGDRHSTGDPNRVSNGELFVYAASMMSRAAREAIGDALQHAITWGVDDPINWHGLPPEAREQWETARHIITTVLEAWVMLWRDLAALDGGQTSAESFEAHLEQWRSLAEQAADTVSGAAVAAAAQRR